MGMVRENGLPERACQKGLARKGLPERACQKGLARKGLPERACQNAVCTRKSGSGSLHCTRQHDFSPFTATALGLSFAIFSLSFAFEIFSLSFATFLSLELLCLGVKFKMRMQSRDIKTWRTLAPAMLWCLRNGFMPALSGRDLSP